MREARGGARKCASAGGLGVLPQNFFCFTCSEIDSNAI